MVTRAAMPNAVSKNVDGSGITVSCNDLRSVVAS
jgi:hypothetical protein